MQINKFNLKLLLIFCAVTILWFHNSAVAQSGRRPKKLLSQPIQPSVTTETITSVEQNEPSDKIEYLLIVGEILNSDSYSETSELNWTLDYCLRKLENQSNLKLKAEVGGKMNFKQAQEIAKKGKNVYILWIGFTLENIGKGKTQVNYANFSVLKPESAEKLFTGRIDSKILSTNGGVMRSKKPISEAAKIGNIGEEIIYRLLRWGWLN